MNDETNTETAIGFHFAGLRDEWQAAGLFDSNAPQIAQKTTAELLREQRLTRFNALCPVEFREKIDRTRLPNLAAWDEADAWGGTHPGLWLWSNETGRGKSRMAWRQFGRAHVERGRFTIKASGQSLCEDYFSHHMDGNPRTFYRSILCADLLIIDDLDKAEFNERNKRTIRELFDELYAHRKSVIVTANEPISFFEQVTGASCVRRMREVCREISF